MFKLNNQIQNYDWGSKTSLTEIFGIDNPDCEPQAELWMGTHPGGCSRHDESNQLLSDIVNESEITILGDYTVNRFGKLPYLFKVLAAHKPLSIQVHPNKKKAEIGFQRENEQGLALDDFARNYKDSNHKPELVYALTPYKAMNGFRPVEDIIYLFKELAIEELKQDVGLLEQEPNSEGLKRFFSSIMMLSGQRKVEALIQLENAYSKPVRSKELREALQYSQEFRKHFSCDVGLFSPFMLNTIELNPGEAMFLFAETPHAYVHGTALEIMANSDNVLRAGLTSKHIDISELVDNVAFTSNEPEKLKIMPIVREGREHYPIPVDDFCFDILYAEELPKEQFVRSAEILFCVDGNVIVESLGKKVKLCPGESVFLPYSNVMYAYRGKGRVARAYN